MVFGSARDCVQETPDDKIDRAETLRPSQVHSNCPFLLSKEVEPLKIGFGHPKCVRRSISLAVQPGEPNELPVRYLLHLMTWYEQKTFFARDGLRFVRFSLSRILESCFTNALVRCLIEAVVEQCDMYCLDLESVAVWSLCESGASVSNGLVESDKLSMCCCTQCRLKQGVSVFYKVKSDQSLWKQNCF